MRTLDEIKAGPMALYSFVNYYLSDLQRGLQTAHLVSELFISHDNIGLPTENSRLHYWARNDRTKIILNGGNCSSLLEILNVIYRKSYSYPWGRFYEDKDSLAGAITCVGIVFPKFYKDEMEQFGHIPDNTDNFIDIMRLIRSRPLG